MTVQLLASHLARKGDRLVQALDPKAVAGLHVGAGKSLNPKLWPCEDSLVLERLPDGAYLCAVADAHWGGSSSEAVARSLSQAWANSREPEPLARLRDCLSQVERHCTLGKQPGDDSETTVILAHLQAHTLSYVSVGDSLLLSFGSRCRLLNRLGGHFMGSYPLARQVGAIDAGRRELSPGDVLLLASDGLEPDCSGLEAEDVLQLFAGGGTLEERLSTLLDRAGDPERGGGRDNLALIAIEV